MIKSTISFLVAFVLIMGLSSDSSFAAPAVGDSASSASSVPSTGDSASSASASAPSTGDSASSAGPASSATGNSGSAPAVSLSGSRRRYVVVAVPPAGVTATVSSSSCPVITSYLKRGWKNDPVQVSRLQSFLKNAQKSNLTVSGVFDEATENAVKEFQRANLEIVLGPWESTRPTGVVYITTLKRINQLACASPLTLDADELSVISKFRSQISGTAIGEARTADVDARENGSEALVVTADDRSVKSDESFGDDNVAATADSTMAGRFWRFIKKLF